MADFNLTFGEALEAMKQDKLVARKEWAESDISLFKGAHDFESPHDEMIVTRISGIDAALFESHSQGIITRLPYISKHTKGVNGNGKIVHGWLPSIEDLLADDWAIIGQWETEIYKGDNDNET